MKISYACVSINEQNLDLQRHALEAVEGDHVFEDHNSVSREHSVRPVLSDALARVGAGDVLVVWRLYRRDRLLPGLIQLVANLGERGAGFQSPSESIGTTTAGGRLAFHIMRVLAEFERSLLIGERTEAGVQTAKRRGSACGTTAQTLAAPARPCPRSDRAGREPALERRRCGGH